MSEPAASAATSQRSDRFGLRAAADKHAEVRGSLVLSSVILPA